MELTNIGDLVVRKSYGGDVTFRVTEMRSHQAIIKGTDFRLLADAPLEDLIHAKDAVPSEKSQRAYIKAQQSVQKLHQDREAQVEQTRSRLAGDRNLAGAQSYFEVPGTVLHLDGDPAYLKKSLDLYKKLRVPAHGQYVPENAMAQALYRLLPTIQPDIVVITGHDGVLKSRIHGDLYSLSSYKNSSNFVEAIQIARQYERNFDALTIVAGACQSHFEALLQAGANFASSPGRVLIHALDPVYIAAKSALTSVQGTIHITDVLSHTVSGIQGVGGIETRGSYRIGLPKPQDLSKLNVVPSAI
ncbi:sporulation peptidase YabG [Paenibacillus sp. CAA11]|uniref:sporulation peptidase YabG n=1 Tax=Paenibacillus sp. CAA11 TaxID=1532905 RepID=UPI000D33BAFF|nr:sporulation peptidase YabG [Paenibacillus sp. CAA11]AWB42806.1 sporulation peptidase YabG [Paenibacillus sp. CAA11]